MSNAAVSKFELQPYSDRLEAALPRDGSPRPNQELREELGLNNEHYFHVRNALLNKGVVTKHQGRGGKTALVVDVSDEVEERLSNKWRYSSYVAFTLAGVVMVLAGLYVFLWRDSDAWVWNALTLTFGAVALLSVGLALQIFRKQDESAHQQKEGMARVLGQIRNLGRGTFTSASDATTIVRDMREMLEAWQASQRQGASGLKGETGE